MGVIFHLQFSEKYMTHIRLVLKVWDLVPSLPPMCIVMLLCATIERNLGLEEHTSLLQDWCTQKVKRILELLETYMTHTIVYSFKCE